MFVDNIRVPQLKVALSLLGVFVVVVAALSCSEHRFTPVADVEVYPAVLEYEVQNATEYDKTVVITNKSVSAKLDIYEIEFADLNDSQLIDDRDEDAVNMSVQDQTSDLGSLQEKNVNDETPINYAWYPGGLASDVSCVEDADCHCVASDGGYCTTEYTNDEGETITIKQQKMGRLFKCGENPFNPSATRKFCVAQYRYFNNTGKVNKAFWGGKVSKPCDPNVESSCSTYGAEYICDAATQNCKSDIRLSFSVEYDLQRLVNVKPGDIDDKEQAAVWRAAEYDGEDSGLCLIDSEGKILEEPVKLFGLNRCDQIALKEGLGKKDVANPLRLKAIDDESVDTSYALYPQAQANYRLMATDFEYDQAKFLAFCNNPSERITHNNIVLDDPIDMDESCYDEDGKLKTELLSIDPAMVKLDKLPVRLVYEPDQGYEPNATLTEKNFTMKIRNSARSGGEEAYARTVNIKINENPGGPPIPVCEASKAEPEPLDQIHLDARNSTSPFGEARKPFSYYWEWAPGGKPAHAADVRLIKSTASFDDDPATSSVTGSWSKEGFPKIKFPVGGRYVVRVKVRDSAQVESGPSAECPKCEEWATCNLNVRPKEKLHVELLWLKGDEVDLDLFLVRERPNGTFSISNAYQDKPDIDPPVMKACGTDTDCTPFKCGGNGFCKNECTTDEFCKGANPAWYCNTQGQCDVLPSGVIECETDEDCGDNYFCNPAKVGSAGYKTICTVHDGYSVNDTCYFMNTEPRWGEYQTLERGCSGNADCTGGADVPFTCGSGNVCDFSCSSSSECLAASSQYVCDHSAAEPVCIGNSIDDDPTLDIDDVDGWGPENISLKEPAPGRYRIVARLYSDELDVLSDKTPNSSVAAYVQIFINGEIALQHELSTEFIEPGTYWKVADIDWTVGPDPVNPGKEKADGEITPLCAGWTLTECVTSDECKEWFGDAYTCAERNYGNWCSNCIGGNSLPADCDPRATCTNDSDCASFGGGYSCQKLTGSFCTCQGSNPYADFDDNPYANPFISTSGGRFIPTDAANPRSIWCDAPTDKFNETDACSTLYQ